MTAPPESALLEAIVAAQPYAALIARPDGRVVAANALVAPLCPAPLGRELDEILGPLPFACAKGPIRFAGGPGPWRELRQSAEAAAGEPVRLSQDLGDGRTMELEAWCRPLPAWGAAESLFFVLLRDRTRERAMERQAQRHEKLRSVGLLAAGVSHEFKNIVATLHGYAQLAQKHERFYPTLAQTVMAYADRVQQLTDSLLSFSRERPQVFEEGDIIKAVERVLALLDPALAQERIALTRDFQPVPTTLFNMGDMEEVFLNLVVNAQQAIRRDGHVHVAIAPRDGAIRIAVSDDGCGIAPEHLPRIFDPFFTTKGALGGGDTPGTGVGLSVSYNIVQEHGGRIEAESAPGAGTTITVELPVRHERRSGEAAPATQERRRDRLQRAARILLLSRPAPAAPLGEVLAHLLAAHRLTVQPELTEAGGAGFDYVIVDATADERARARERCEAVWSADRTARVICIIDPGPEALPPALARRLHGLVVQPLGLKDLPRLIR